MTSPTIKVYLQVADHPTEMVGIVTDSANEVDSLRQTSELLRALADTFDQMTNAYEVLAETKRILG